MSRFSAVILGCAGLRLTENERRFFAHANPFGFILFARNCETADQVRALTADLRDAVSRDAPIFIDQEGGRVQRLRPPLATDWRPPLDDAIAAGDRASDALALRYAIIAAELRALGIDGNCVPALDVARAETHPFLRNRLLGSDADTVARLGRAVANAHLAGGVLPVIKHMPGHGRGTADSHLHLPRTDADMDALQSDFATFAALSDLPLGMTAHMVFEALDERAATVSETMIGLIRDRIGFDGLLMTDDISMQALSGDVASRGRAALDAGCDAVLHCNGELDEMRALRDATGAMTDAAQARAEAALAARRPAPAVDIAALRATLETLLPASVP
ncbi:glycoside hydrolase family 3 N-terminal domain-containing protein [Citreimonas salinaria]|uniref:beta-N-acetylhexosaminidase n=1 Tax=Citreimonas salinaria TaxID=321339 RepID=A0A1H3KR57_9RHOB|nr:glycoside hydrolase family 3 N-terminal domain-containing protein [Citreimonas salinaria]SDY54278.1 beta-N-acetylhexosaminidase [Citreimonas salinaria]